MKTLWAWVKNFFKLRIGIRIKRILLSIFFLLCIIIATLSSLVSTEVGSRWVVGHLATLLHLQLGEIHGNCLTGLDISELNYQKDNVIVHAEHVSFRWQPVNLLYTAVSVQSLSADSIRIELPPSQNTNSSSADEWPSLALPVRVELNRMELRNIKITQNNSQTNITKITGSWSLGTFHLRASDVAIENEQAKVKLAGTMALRYPYEIESNVEWQYHQSSLADTQFGGRYSGKLKLTGDIKKLHVQNNFILPAAIKMTADVSPELKQKNRLPHISAIADWDEQSIPKGMEDFFAEKNNAYGLKPITATRGHITLTGWINQYHLDGKIIATMPDGHLDLSAKAQGFYSQSDQHSHTQIEKLLVVVNEKDASVVPDNSVNLSGEIDGNLADKNWQWNVSTQAEHFHLHQWLPEWPSDLQFSFKSSGDVIQGAQQKITFSINELRAQGDLRNLAVAADGDFAFDGEHWRSQSANLSVGANQLKLKGQAGKLLALEWKINAPLLNQIDPRLNGSVVSSGTVTGDVASPQLKIDAQINQFVWHDYAIENLSFSLRPQQQADVYDLILDASYLQWQNQHITHLQVKGNGALAQHQLKGTIEQNDFGSVAFALDSHWQNKKWQGQWREFAINAKKIPHWYLSASSPMQADGSHFDAGKLCLTTTTSHRIANQEAFVGSDIAYSTVHQQTLQKLAKNEIAMSDIATQDFPSVCVVGRWAEHKETDIQTILTAVPVNQLQAWFKPDVILEGVIDGQLHLHVPSEKSPVLEAHLQSRGAQFLYQFQGGNTEVYPLRNGNLDLSLKNNIVNSALVMDWEKYGSVNADAKLNLGDKKIQGKLQVALTDLAPLESLLPFLNNVSGAATANISLAGTLTKPEIVGKASLTNGGANLPKLGLILKDADVQISSQSSGAVHVDGKITSGDGALMVRGDVENLGTPEWQWHSNIFGANIRIIEQPQLTATVSPNLTLSANAQAINLAGSSEIPWARAALKTLPESATRVSRDVTVIEGKSLLQNNTYIKNAIPFYTNVLLYFGDDVRFKGFGLDSQLTGKINVFKEENRQTLTTGFVAVGKGNYKAYGQDLTIERGRLIFQGPYDNPGLDIRASRVVENATAGLEIGGTLQNPKSTVFSIPATSDSEAMAMLLTGKPLSQSSQADAYSLIGAISSLGMDRGQMMTGDIAKFFRIDEITINSEKGLEQSALWVGKYVTPKLFIRYIVGLFDQAFAVGMRYQLNEKLRLEAESGKNQSVDVIYKIER